MTSKTQTEEYLRATQLPVATKSYTVISHGYIIDKVREKLNENGFIVTDELYKAEMHGDIALGFMKIENGSDPDMAMTFNWTNSYNKVVRFHCSIGGFIYDNETPFVSTNSSASWNRKHTGTALDEAEQVIDAMVSQANAHFAEIIKMKEKFKLISVSRKEYAKLMGLLYFDKKVISPDQVSLVRKEYDKPSFKYSDQGTLWEVYKMIMFAIADQPPKLWYKQQIDINNYIQIMYNVAAMELPNEDDTDTLEMDTVDNEVVQTEVEFTTEEETTEIIAIASEEEVAEELYGVNNHNVESSFQQPVEMQFITDEDEDEALDAVMIPILPVQEVEEEPVFVLDQTESILSEEQIEMVKEEYGIVEKDEVVDTFVENEELFEIMPEDDDSEDDIPWFTNSVPTEEEVTPTLIPDSMREAVSEILSEKYHNERKVVKSEEFSDSFVFGLNTDEFFVIDK